MHPFAALVRYLHRAYLGPANWMDHGDAEGVARMRTRPMWQWFHPTGAFYDEAWKNELTTLVLSVFEAFEKRPTVKAPECGGAGHTATGNVYAQKKQLQHLVMNQRTKPLHMRSRGISASILSRAGIRLDRASGTLSNAEAQRQEAMLDVRCPSCKWEEKMRTNANADMHKVVT